MINDKESILIEFIKNNLKYEFIEGEFLTSQYGERDSLKDVLLKWRLKKSIRRINSHLDIEDIDEAIKYVTETINSEESLVNINSKMNDFLINSNLKLKKKLNDPPNNNENIKLIDWENIRRNEFLFVNNFRIEGKKNIFELDFVIFVNGIPIVILENKISNKDSFINKAYAQLNRYKNELPQVFSTNVFNGILNARELYIGTIDSNLEQYVKWGEANNDYGKSFKIILEGEALLDFVKNFIVSASDKSRRICKYYQFNTVNKVITRLTTKQDNKSRGGLIYYPVGAGKYLTMNILVNKIRMTNVLKESTIIIVTDNISLSDQIYNNLKSNFNKVFDILKPNTKNELREFLFRSQSQVIITTIQKFTLLDRLENDKVDHNFIVLVDNAERFQKGQMALNMRTTLSNAIYIGFTSIPNNETKLLFGEYIDNFSIENVINNTLTDLKYENRASILDENIFKSNNDFILNNKDRIDFISKDIINHYKNIIYPKGLKALLVCSSRNNCIEYFSSMNKYIKELFEDKIEVKVLISNSRYNSSEISEYHVNNAEQEIILKRFKSPLKEDTLSILIVNEKLLSGFDSPILKCLYIDRLLKGEKLMQSIERINRSYTNNRESGYIIDYYGIEDHLQKIVNIKGNFISKIYIKNVRNISNVEINLSKYDKKHLILTGKNGSGKTSVLQEFKKFMKSVENNEVQYTYQCKEKIDDLHSKIDRVENNVGLSTHHKEMSILNYNMDLELYMKVYEKYCKNISIDFNTVDLLCENYNNGKYILAYFNAKRDNILHNTKNIGRDKSINRFKIDDYPEESFISYLLDLKTQQSFAKNEGDDDTSNLIEAWFNDLEEALKEIFEDETLKLDFNSQNYDFKIRQYGKQPFGFEVLSDGYSSILQIITNLIMKMEPVKGDQYRNNSRNFIYDIQGVVIIDEIETHLHIELQKKVLPLLTKLFPKIQFIVSTHSPFVINSLENAIIYDLEKKIQVENLSRYSYKGIVEGYYYIDQYSYKIKVKMERYEELVNKSEKNDDEEIEMLSIRNYLREIPTDLAPELVYKFNDIELKRLGDQYD